jgi:hypothetical protein
MSRSVLDTFALYWVYRDDFNDLVEQGNGVIPSEDSYEYELERGDYVPASIKNYSYARETGRDSSQDVCVQIDPLLADMRGIMSMHILMQGYVDPVPVFSPSRTEVGAECVFLAKDAEGIPWLVVFKMSMYTYSNHRGGGPERRCDLVRPDYYNMESLGTMSCDGLEERLDKQLLEYESQLSQQAPDGLCFEFRLVNMLDHYVETWREKYLTAALMAFHPRLGDQSAFSDLVVVIDVIFAYMP